MMVGTSCGTFGRFIDITKGFFLVVDTGFMNVTTEGPSDISFTAMYDRQLEIAEILRRDPAVAYINSTIGAGGPNPTHNYGRFFFALKPRHERGENSTPASHPRPATTNTLTRMA